MSLLCGMPQGMVTHKPIPTGLQRPYCCVISLSNKKIWMLSFYLYFDQYFHFCTIQKVNAIVFRQVGCLRDPHLSVWTL